MNKKFYLRFILGVGTFYYCYDANLGPFLSKSLSNACPFHSLSSIKDHAPRLTRYFFDFPVDYSIIHD